MKFTDLTNDRFTSIAAMTVLLILIGHAGSASAAFVLIEDWEAATLNTNPHGYNGWVSSNTTSTAIQVVSDPVDADNQVLRLRGVAGSPGQERWARKLVSATEDIDNGGTGTLFMRVRANDLVASNSYFGMTDGNTAASASEYEVRAWLDSGGDIRGGISSDLGNYAANIWYNVWFVIRNPAVAGADDYDVFIQGGAFVSQTKIGSNIPFTFTGAGSPIDNLFLFADAGGAGGREILFDDFYIDNTGENLTNILVPVPEPPAVILWCGLMLGVTVGYGWQKVQLRCVSRIRGHAA